MVATVLLGTFRGAEPCPSTIHSATTLISRLLFFFFTVFLPQYGAVRPQVSLRCGSVPIMSIYSDQIWAPIQVQKHLRDVIWKNPKECSRVWANTECFRQWNKFVLCFFFFNLIWYITLHYINQKCAVSFLRCVSWRDNTFYPYIQHLHSAKQHQTW